MIFKVEDKKYIYPWRLFHPDLHEAWNAPGRTRHLRGGGLDDGSMGGGEVMTSLLDKEHNFPEARKGVFHYTQIVIIANINPLLMGHHGSRLYNTLTKEMDGDAIILERVSNDYHIAILLAQTFMHHLGYKLGLAPKGFKPTPFEGIDTLYYPTYHSCMNYYYNGTLVDYSEGLNKFGGHDFDDWGHINLRRVATSWKVVEP